MVWQYLSVEVKARTFACLSRHACLHVCTAPAKISNMIRRNMRSTVYIDGVRLNKARSFLHRFSVPHRVHILPLEGNPISLVFQNIDLPLSARRICPPPATKGGTHSPGGEGDGGSIFWKTREIGLPSYSKIFTLWCSPTLEQGRGERGLPLVCVCDGGFVCVCVCVCV